MKPANIPDSMIDIVALIFFFVLELVFIFRGSTEEQKMSHRLKFFYLLVGWNLAYYWATSRAFLHVFLALALTLLCYWVFSITGLEKSLSFPKRSSQTAVVSGVLFINAMVLFSALAVCYLVPFSIHAAANEKIWVWGSIIPWLRRTLWVIGGVAILIWSFNLFGRTGRLVYGTLICVTAVTWVYLIHRVAAPEVRQASLDVLAHQISAGQVQKITIIENNLEAETDQGILKTTKENGVSTLDTLRSLGVSDQDLHDIVVDVRNPRFWETQNNDLALIFLSLIPLLILFLVLYIAFTNNKNSGQQFINNRDSGQQFVNSQPNLEPREEHSGIVFADVGGANEAKEALKDIVQFLKEPQAFTYLGAVLPKGVLLEGPPGTGKTLLARAVAGEAGVPFFYISGSEFIEMFVGVGASRVRSLFDKAKQKAPCVIFIDELDAIGQRRESSLLHNSENNQTLNQLLTELDGFEQGISVVVIAATNRIDILDEALIRPGRFDQRVYVSLPNLEERVSILNIHMKGKPLGSDADANAIARCGLDLSGADLAAMVNRSAILASKAKSKVILQSHLLTALKQVGVIIPDLQPPREWVDLLTGQVIGQEEAAKTLAVALYQHFCDIRSLTDHPERAKSKPNVLLFGPPGTGKTALIQNLARQLEIPFATFDAISLLDGQGQVREALGRLIMAARQDLRRAKYGVLCVYGIEDLLLPNIGRFQEELGRIMEEAVFDVSWKDTSFANRNVTLNTSHILFICEGSFQVKFKSGMRKSKGPESGPIQVGYEDLVETGFRPRLLDKFSFITQTYELSEKHMLQILSEGEAALLHQHQKRFAAMGTQLKFDSDALNEIVHEAMNRGEGARWLNQILEEVLKEEFLTAQPKHELVITAPLVWKALAGEEVIPARSKLHDVPGAKATPAAASQEGESLPAVVDLAGNGSPGDAAEIVSVSSASDLSMPSAIEDCAPTRQPLTPQSSQT